MLLQTDRLTVRPVEASDWKAMQAIWLDFSKSPYACFDCPHSTEEADVRPRIARWARAAQTGLDHLFFSVCLEAQVIGYISANIRPDGYELGYCFHSDFQGKGYAARKPFDRDGLSQRAGSLKAYSGNRSGKYPFRGPFESPWLPTDGHRAGFLLQESEGTSYCFPGRYFRKEI